MNYKPGDFLEIEVNQGLREAWVLAKINDRLLIEYDMPNGTSSLRVIKEAPLIRFQWPYKNVSYSRLPKYWVAAIAEAETWELLSWSPQGVSFGKAKADYECFLKEIKEEIFKQTGKERELF